MKYFSAFSGIGGFEMCMPKHWQCVGYSEISQPAMQIYEKHFPTHKNYGDITRIRAEELPDFDLFVGGFPCQDLSIAGQRAGISGSRSGLFYEIVRIVRAKRPTHILLENVPGMLSSQQGKAFQEILWQMAELGYDCEWSVFHSTDYGKPQSRKRVYIKGTIRQGTQGLNARQRGQQTTPILLNIRQVFSSQNYKWEDIGQSTARNWRDYARIPNWLDEWLGEN